MRKRSGPCSAWGACQLRRRRPLPRSGSERAGLLCCPTRGRDRRAAVERLAWQPRTTYWLALASACRHVRCRALRGIRARHHGPTRREQSLIRRLWRIPSTGQVRRCRSSRARLRWTSQPCLPRRSWALPLRRLGCRAPVGRIRPTTARRSRRRIRRRVRSQHGCRRNRFHQQEELQRRTPPLPARGPMCPKVCRGFPCRPRCRRLCLAVRLQVRRLRHRCRAAASHTAKRRHRHPGPVRRRRAIVPRRGLLRPIRNRLAARCASRARRAPLRRPKESRAGGGLVWKSASSFTTFPG